MTSSASDPIRDWLREVVGGKRFVVVAPILQECGALARQVTDLGAAGCYLLAGRTGTGAPPPPDLGPQRVLGLPASDLMGAIHTAERAFRALDPEIVAEIDAFDPRHEALALGTFVGNGQPVAGRRMFGARPADWQALEDKVVVDAVWDAAGVPRAPSEVVPVGEAAAAAARLDAGEGTVWAADAREGFHGGATSTFHVYDDTSRRRAEAHLAARADRVRVMPFLEGIPCSIHGLVLPDVVLAFRPAEMVVLRLRGGTGFLYMRAATFWDPAPADREAMRAVARRVGAHLRDTVGYRGAFTVDGILARNGFLPTELNPRVGAAMRMVVPDTPLELLHYAIVEGARFPVDPLAWEADRVAVADRRRVARLMLAFDRPVAASYDVALTRDPDGTWRAQEGEEVAHAHAVVGPGATGGYVGFEILPSAWPVGRSVCPLAVELVAWADAHLGSGIGPVTSPRSVR